MTYEEHMALHGIDDHPRPPIDIEEPKYMVTEAGENITVIYDDDLFLLRLSFTNIPTGLTRALLKENGFRWDEVLSTWNRSLNDPKLKTELEALFNSLGAIEEEF